MRTSVPPASTDTAIAKSMAASGDRLDDRQAIAGEIRALALADAPVLVKPLAPPLDGMEAPEPWVGRIEKLDPVTGDFVLGSDSASGRRIDATFRIACRHGARLLGVYDGVHVEFELDRLGARYDALIWRLLGRLPTHLYRLQRRASYRVRVIEAAVWLHRFSRWTPLVVEDMSEGGLRVRIPATQATPVEGTRWDLCNLALPASSPITCDLQVVHVTRPENAPNGRPDSARTAGLRFERIEPLDAFELRRWIGARQLEEAARRLGTY